MFNRLIEDDAAQHPKDRFLTKFDRRVIFIAASAVMSTILVLLIVMFAGLLR